MNAREKFLNIMDFKTDSPVLNWEFAYWYDTLVDWYKQGLPRKHPPAKKMYSQWVGAEGAVGLERDLHDYFNSDEGIQHTGIYNGMLPAFDVKIIEEDEENTTFVRKDGKTVKTRKDGSSMPCFIDYPVKTEEDFENIKKRFDPESNQRFPNDWELKVSQFKDRSYPLRLGGGTFSGFYSVIRELMGTENSLYVFFDNPDFAVRILDFFVDYYIRLYKRILSDIDVDFILIWEDLAFNTGPLVSPEIFKEFILPYYKKFTSKMRRLGVKNFIVDTDGNFEVLIPLFIEGGVTGFYPFEVAAGMDIEKVREKFPQLVMMGGVDKRALMNGKEAIDCEIEKVARVLKTGGYQPYTDHMVPPGVPFENYKYYRRRLYEVIMKQSNRQGY
jgi:hypothetical protein